MIRWLLSAPPVALLSAYSLPVTGPLARISASPSRTTTTSCDGINPDMRAHLPDGRAHCSPAVPGPGARFSAGPGRYRDPLTGPSRRRGRTAACALSGAEGAVTSLLDNP